MTKPATTSAPTAGAARKWLIHGDPGAAKTPFALSYPCKKMVYVATDRKEIVLPRPESDYEFADYAGATDPYSFVKSVLEYDWAAEGADAICIDTMTNLGRDYLKAAVAGPHYNAKVVNFGGQAIKLSDKPHYGLAHKLMAMTIEHVKRCPLDVLCVFWSGYDQPRDGGGAFGGPLTVNINESRSIAGEFANILYMRSEERSGRATYNVYTENNGIWIARLAGVYPNTTPKIELGTNPAKAWETIAKLQAQKSA